VDPIDFDLLCLKIALDTSLNPTEPDGEVSQYEVEVYYEDEAEKAFVVGRFEVWRFQIDAYRQAPTGTFFELFDSHSEEALSLHRWLFDNGSDDFKEELGEGQLVGQDLLYITSASCEQEFADSAYMLAAVHRITLILGGGCAYTVIWPWDVPHPDMEKLTSEQLDAYWNQHAKAERMWRPLGFNRLHGTPILLRDMAVRAPTIPEILGEGS